MTVGGNFVITGSTVYSSNYLTLSANSASPLISYLNVYRPAESANASIRWNEPNRYWDILDVNPGGSYSKILTANLISNSISSTNTATIPSSAIANTLNNSISSVNSALTSNVNILNSGIAAAYSRANTSANSFNGTSGVVTPTSGSVTLTSTNGITISGSGNTFTFNTPQDLRTTASPTFTNLAYTGTLTGGTGIVNIGSNQIYKDAAGNVGIGKVPSVLLDINGFVNAGNMQTGNGISTDPAFIELGGLRSGAGISYIDFHALAGTDNQTRVARNSGANGTFDLLNTGTGGIFLTQVGAGPIVFSVSNTEKARFDSSGNFGIGTTTPSTTLSVASVGGSQKRALFISSGNGTGSAGGVYITSATTSGGNGAVYEAIGQRSDSNGSAQFSGTTALGRLRTDASISTSGITLGRMTFGGNPTGTALSNILYSAQIAGVSDTAWSSSTAMGTALAFYTGATGIDINSVLGDAGTEAMRISSAGNLGIGNTAPGTKLDVTGVTRSTTFSVGASGGTAAFGAGTISSDANWGMYFRANTGAASAEFVFVNGAGTERMRISSTDGMMTINTTASPLLGISNVAGLSTITSRNNNANGIPGIGLTNGLAWTTAKNTGQIRFDGLTTGSTYTEYASIYSISDTNTATGAPTVLAFNTSNGSASATERMRIDSSGNVGIGTTAPTAKLHATSTSSTKYGLISQTPVVGLTAGNTVNMAYFVNSRDSLNDGIRIVNYRISTGSGVGNWETESYSIERSVDSTGNGAHVKLGPNTLSLGTAAVDRMFIDSSGNVGIGTTSPAYQLNVQSLATAATKNRDIVLRTGDQTNYYRLSMVYNTTTASGAFPAQSGGLYWEQGGGYGTSGGLVISTNNTNAGPLIFGTADTERMRIDSSGNVGIGTSTPSTKLHVVGNITQAAVPLTSWNAPISVYQNNVASFWNNGPSTVIGHNVVYGTSYATTRIGAGYAATIGFNMSGAGSMDFNVAGTDVAGSTPSFTNAMRISASGGVSIGNTTDPGATNLSVTGTITASSFSGNSTSATNLASGSAGTIPYQSASGTTAMLAAGTSGNVLISGGAAAPSWSATTGTGSVVKANSPALTGNPTAPTPTTGDNDTSIATTAFVNAQINSTGLGGSSQTWTNVTGSRASATTYTNSTGKPIYVSIIIQSAGSGSYSGGLTVNGSLVDYQVQYTANPGYHTSLKAIVPPAGTYSLTNLSVATISNWWELR